jgi:hypothetical protein
MLIHVFRLLDQLILATVALGIIYFRPEIAIQGGSYILEATFRISDTAGVILLGVGWVIIFDYFIR